jgi:hypothetical protein
MTPVAKIKVWPTKASALNVAHPIDGKPKADGAMWEQDGFTARMLSDGIMTRDEGKAFKPAPAAPAQPAPPEPGDA